MTPPDVGRRADVAGAADLASCVVSPDGVIESASPALAATLGVAEGEVIGAALDDVLGNWTTVAGTSPTTIQMDGEVDRYVEIHTSPLDGGPRTVVAFFDVTAHRAAQRALAEYAEFPDRNPGPVLRLDRAASVVSANPAALRVFGADLVGASWFDRCPGMTRELWDAMCTATEPALLDVDFPEASYTMSYVSSADGDIVFAFGTDITDRKAAEERLAEVARFPDMNPGPVLRVAVDGSILLANRAARDVFGEHIAEGSWKTVFPPCADQWDLILRSPDPVPLETRIGDRDYQFTHRMDPRSNMLFVFGADITEQKQAERGIMQADRMATLGTLAAGIAHELNNPAAAARRAAEQLREAFARQQEARFVLESLELSSDAVARLESLESRSRVSAEGHSDLDAVTRSDREAEIEDWLDDHDVDDEWDIAPVLVEQGIDVPALEELAAVVPPGALDVVARWMAATFPVYRLAYEIGQASGRISEIVGAMKSYSFLGRAERQPVDLHEGLDNTLVILRNKLKVGVDVDRAYAEDMPPVQAFGSELNQVWTNLIDNAVDAMGGKGVLRIETQVDDDTAVVRITDDGPGIAADAVGRVFDPFFTTKEPGKGTGLGLATTYAIVTEKHGGSIDVDSEPGRTTFTVRLPIEETRTWQPNPSS